MLGVSVRFRADAQLRELDEGTYGINMSGSSRITLASRFSEHQDGNTAQLRLA